MNNRIKQIRAAKKETQASFAAALGLSRNYIALLEAGERVPSDRTIQDICRVYGVDPVWLRTGVGEMFHPQSREDEIVEFCSGLLGDGATDFQKDFVAGLAKLTPEQWDFLYDLIKTLAGNEEK